LLDQAPITVRGFGHESASGFLALADTFDPSTD
jgi:hypothetical protein